MPIIGEPLLGLASVMRTWRKPAKLAADTMVTVTVGKVVLEDKTEEPNTDETNLGAGGGHLSSFDERGCGFGCTKGNRRFLLRAVAASCVAVAARCLGSVHG
jgi:hypothetical protein